MSEHTPGPWHVGVQNDNLYILDRPPRPSSDDINPDREATSIARIFQVDGGDSVESANAQLIASAPDLLAACQLFERWDTSPHATEADAAAMRSAIHSAITRATGSQSRASSTPATDPAATPAAMTIVIPPHADPLEVSLSILTRDQLGRLAEREAGKYHWHEAAGVAVRLGEPVTRQIPTESNGV